MSLLVTGARGNVGRAVLDGLLAAGVPADRLRASSRDPAVLELPPGVAAVAADLEDPATLDPAFDGVEQAFLYAASPEGVAATAKAARAAGVTHLVMLSSVSVLDEDPADQIGARHRAAEAALVDAGVTTTLLRPGAFATNALWWAREIAGSGRVALPVPGSHVTPIHERDIADVAVAALVEDGAVRGGAHTLTGPASLSFRDQIGVLGAELGRDLEVVELGADEYRASMSAAPPGIADTLLRLWEASDGIPQPVEDVRRLTGRPARTFADWAHEHRAAFGG